MARAVEGECTTSRSPVITRAGTFSTPAPTLVVIAEHDEVIVRARSDALVAKLPAGLARVEVVRGAAHNRLDYAGLLAAFLASG